MLKSILLAVTMLSAAAFSGCSDDIMGTIPGENVTIESTNFSIEDKNGNPVSIDEADNHILIMGSLTTPKYKSWSPIDHSGYTVQTYYSIFVNFKEEGLGGELIDPIDVRIDGNNMRMSQWHINKQGSYRVFKIFGEEGGRTLHQEDNPPPYELSFFYDSRENSDCWEGSLNNWGQSNNTAWFPAFPGEYFGEAKQGDDLDYPEPNDRTFVTVRRYQGDATIDNQQVRWYTENNRGTPDDITDDTITLTFKVNENGTISEPENPLNPADVIIYFP